MHGQSGDTFTQYTASDGDSAPFISLYTTPLMMMGLAASPVFSCSSLHPSCWKSYAIVHERMRGEESTAQTCLERRGKKAASRYTPIRFL